MPTKVCDRSPCDSLSAMLEVLVNVKDEDHLEMLVLAKSKIHAVVTFTYCPFCGTRISIDVTEKYLNQRRTR